jgi:hypothetical protein
MNLASGGQDTRSAARRHQGFPTGSDAIPSWRIIWSSASISEDTGIPGLSSGLPAISGERA